MAVSISLTRFVNIGTCVRTCLLLLVGFLVVFHITTVEAQEEPDKESDAEVRQDCVLIGVPCPPPAPGGLEESSTSMTTITLIWDSVAGTSNYQVDGGNLDEEETTSRNITDSGLECGTTYSYQVRAYGDGRTYAAEWGDWSDEVDVTTDACPPEITIEGPTADIVEGGTARFRIESDPAPTSLLIVYIDVEDPGGYLSDRAPTIVRISSNSSFTTLSLATDNDDVDEENGEVTVTIEEDRFGDDYMVGDDDEASVTVRDNDEPSDTIGVVSLSDTSPEVGDRVTATLSDADGGISNRRWRWRRSSTGSGTGSAISGATSSSYTLTTADAGKYIRATVSYRDNHGPNKSAQSDWEEVEDSPSEVSLSDTSPEVGDSVTATLSDADGGISNRTWRWRRSNTGSGTGSAISGATSSSYTLTTADAGKYIRATVSYRDNHGPNKSAQSDWEEVEDSDGEVSLSDTSPEVGDRVTATLSDADGGISNRTWRWRRSNTGSGTGSAISGATSSSYTLTTADAGKYIRATVSYRDNHGPNKSAQSDWEEVEDSDGEVSLSDTSPEVGDRVTATLSDADGGISNRTWRWRRSNTGFGIGSAISGATSSSYTLTTADAGKYIRATVSYRDNHGPNKAAQSDWVEVELEPEIAITDLDTSMDAGESDSFTVTASNMDTSLRYNIRVTTDDSDIGFNNDCRDKQDDVIIPANRSSHSATLTLYQCNVGGWKVTASLRRGTTVVDMDMVTRDTIGVVSLSDTSPEVGDRVTATLSDADGGISNRTWRWRRSNTGSGTGSAISGATSSSYTLTTADAGKYIRATVTYRDNQGPNKSAQSDWVSVSVTDTIGVLDLSDETPEVGDTIEATLDDDNDPVTEESWRWRRSNTGTDIGSAISGATSSSYTLTTADAGKYIRATVTYRDNHGPNKSAQSDWEEVEDSDGEVSLSDTSPEVGDRVTATLSDADGGISNRTWRWRRSNTGFGIGSAISGATSSSYTLTTADAGKYIRATVSYRDNHGPNKAAQSGWEEVEDSDGEVSLSDTSPEVGDSITATLSDADGGISNRTWRWRRSNTGSGTGSAISGATRSSYTLTTDDMGKYIRATVTYRDNHGSNKFAQSDWVLVALESEIAITGLDTTIKKGGNDSFTVEASNLDTNLLYNIRVTTDNSDIGFDQDCDDREELMAVPPRMSSYSKTFTLYACETTGGEVEAILRRGSIELDSATQTVTVTEPEQISIIGLRLSMEVGENDPFKVTASNLDPSKRYSISVNVSRNSVYLRENCSQVIDSASIEPRSTQGEAGFDVFGCNAGVGTVTVTLNGATSSTVATKDVIVYPAFTGPPIISRGSDRKSINANFSLPTANLPTPPPHFHYEIATLRSDSQVFNPANYESVDIETAPSSPWVFTPTKPGSYKMALRACVILAGPPVETKCGPDYLSTDPLYKLAPPDELDLTPQPLRKARLSWNRPSGNLRGTGYTVEIQALGDTWTAQQEVAPSSPTGTHFDFDLDAMLMGSPPKGLADDPYAYEARIRASQSGNNALDSEYSDSLIIIDSTIRRVDGRSPGASGQADLAWESVWRLLSDSDYDSGDYHLRYRKSYDNPERDHWNPDTFLPPQDTSNDPTSVHTDVIAGLEFNEIYAIQLRYELESSRSDGTTGTTRIYAGRDVYVWPAPPADPVNASDPKRFPAQVERLATYPFFGHWPEGEFHYTVCENTFFPTNMQTEWGDLIKHAFQQWEEAAPDLVSMHPTVGSCNFDGSPMDMVGSIYNITNEVFMVDTEGIGSLFGLALGQLLNANELFLCVHNAPACVISPYYNDLDKGASLPLVKSDPLEPKGSVDVLINKGRREGQGLGIPGGDSAVSEDDIRFNTCRPRVDTTDANGNTVPSLNPGHGYSNYELMVHEAGHALGLSNYVGVDSLSEERAYYMAHPDIPDTVLNYDSEVDENYRINKMSGVRERYRWEADCSPHPFDILAIYALYQTVVD